MAEDPTAVDLDVVLMPDLGRGADGRGSGARVKQGTVSRARSKER